ncbi:MAG TPA: hypothetical protein PKW33_18860 [Anaerolineaceae bacterium]|nr:hypothetical protein [Anaerolineaceae bacterium]HPN53664.1 hypothetical protein [Anaerolineaceae bacterium]
MSAHEHCHHQVHWIFWPFVALWRFLALIIEITGRLVGAILGFALMVVGLIATLTIIGAIVGLPLMLIGGLLTLRSIF